MFCLKENQKVLLNSQYLNEYLQEQVKTFITGLIEEILEVEISEFINRKRYVRIKNPSGVKLYRNGYRWRYLMTIYCKILQIRIPRLRASNYSPRIFNTVGILEPALEQMLIQLWSDGNSYRDLKNFVNKVYGSEVSLGFLSRMVEKINKYVEEYHQKRILKIYDAIFVDGLEICIKELPPRKLNEYGYRKRRKIGKNAVVLAVLGQRSEGKRIIREILDYRIAVSENTEEYTKLLQGLKDRGLNQNKIKVVVHDGEDSISAALKIVYGEGKIPEQECMFHKLMNIMKVVKEKKNELEIKEDIWSVYNSKEEKDYKIRKKRLIKKWEKMEPDAVAVFCTPDNKLRTKYKLKEIIAKTIHTNNPIERYFRELRRRIKVIGIFESIKSADRLLFLTIEALNQRRGSLPTNGKLKFTH